MRLCLTASLVTPRSSPKWVAAVRRSGEESAVPVCRDAWRINRTDDSHMLGNRHYGTPPTHTQYGPAPTSWQPKGRATPGSGDAVSHASSRS